MTADKALFLSDSGVPAPLSLCQQAVFTHRSLLLCFDCRLNASVCQQDFYASFSQVNVCRLSSKFQMYLDALMFLDDVLLAEFPPEEEFEILEDIVPLSEMPRTG